jgi:hypothetical protein
MLPTNLLTFSSFAVAAAAGAYESIASATGTGSSATITFSSIPQTYQHLQIRGIVRNDEATTGIRVLQMRLNSDTGSNYALHALFGDGSSVDVAGLSTQTQIIIASGVVSRGGNTANILGATIIDIHDYANTSKNTTTRHFSGLDLNGSGRVLLNSGLWIDTSAVTSISLITSAGNFNTQTQFALYGIKGA